MLVLVHFFLHDSINRVGFLSIVYLLIKNYNNKLNLKLIGYCVLLQIESVLLSLNFPRFSLLSAVYISFVLLFVSVSTCLTFVFLFLVQYVLPQVIGQCISPSSARNAMLRSVVNHI